MRKVSLIAVIAVAGAVALSMPVFAGDWVANGSTWEYHENGNPTASRWVQGANGQTWYYVKSNCKMASSEWVQSGGAWYYMNSNGTMAINQWVQSGGDWYYMGGNGVMATNTSIEGYQLGSDGKMKLAGAGTTASGIGNTSSGNGKSKSEYSAGDLVGTYSGYVYYSGSKADSRISIYDDRSEIYAEIFYEDSEGDERGTRYRVSKTENGFKFAAGKDITDKSGIWGLLGYEYENVKFDGTRLKKDFTDYGSSFVVDKN